jgi:hypothetical protein
MRTPDLGSNRSLHVPLWAALLWSRQGGAVIAAGQPLEGRFRNAYWLASQVNGLHWQRLLADSRQRALAASSPAAERAAFTGLVAVQVQSLLFEPLQRVICATAYRLEATGADGELAPVAESVLSVQKRLRQQCWQAWGGGGGPWLQAALEMHRLQSLVERWSDWMVAQVAAGADLTALAFEPHQLKAYQRAAGRLGEGNRSEIWSLASCQLITDMQPWEAWSVRTDVDTERLLRAALGLLPPGQASGWDALVEVDRNREKRRR